MKTINILDNLYRLQARSVDLTEELNIRLSELYKWYNNQINIVSDDMVSILNNPEYTYKPNSGVKQLLSVETADTYAKYPEDYVGVRGVKDIELSFQKLCVQDKVINIDNTDYGTKSWPGFWLYALLGCKTTRVWILEEDFDILYHLNDLKVELYESNENTESFQILFYFTENQYFTNDKLWRKFNFNKDDVYSESSEVNWTNYEMPTSYYGFFKFFNSEIDYDDLKMGMYIKDKIWRNPLKYVMRYQAQINNEPVESDSDDESVVNSQVGTRYPFSWLFSK